jgi:hypothetical protein
LKSNRIFLVFSILCLFSPAISMASDSLFDEQNSRRLDTTEVMAFGPKAGNFRYDKTMLNAARIAADRAHAHSQSTCWRYVKKALLAANTIDSYPKTVYAKQAGTELTGSYGFKKLAISDPYKAPLGSVLVYGGAVRAMSKFARRPASSATSRRREHRGDR